MYYPPYPSDPSSAAHFHYDNDNPWMGKRHLYPINLECGPERKRVRQNLSEERSTIQQGESHPSQRLATPDLCLSSFTDSFPPFSTIPPAPEAIVSPSAPATSSYVIAEPESAADWSIIYNTKVKREVDVSVVRTLDVGLGISCLTFSKDGKYLAVGFSDNGRTNIYDVQTGDKTCSLREHIYAKNQDEYMRIGALCFSPNGLYLVTGQIDGLARVWEISKKHVRNVLRFSTGKIGHCIELSPNGRLIASSNYEDCDLKIWNWRDGSRKIFQVSDKCSNNIRFSPDGKYIAVALQGPEVVICNVRTGQFVKKLMDDTMLSVAFMPDGTGLISGGWDRTVKCWDISFLRFGWQDGRRKAMETGTVKEFLSVRQHEDEVQSVGFKFVAVSSNSRWVVSFSNDRVIRFSNIHSDELHCELRPPHALAYFNFSPITGFLATYSYARSRLLLWRFQD